MLAAFITPALFWGGAAAMSAPIIIHLLARRRFKRIRWAAMDFLVDAERRNRRRINMEDWILLLLRCLAILLIGLMVSRPFIKPAGAAAMWGGTQQTERIFVLDDSLSMAYESTEQTPFALAKEGVRNIIAGIRRDTPDDTVTILRMSAPDTPIESGTYLDEQQTEELLSRLEALAPTQRAIDADRVMAGIVEVFERSPGMTNAVVYIISDFQRKDWVDRERSAEGIDGDAGTSSVFAPLQDWTNDARNLHLMLINVGPDAPVNRAVTELHIRGGKLVAGTAGTIRAKVANFSNNLSEDFELQLSVGHFVQPSKTISQLAAQQAVSVDLEAEFPQAGAEVVRVELPADALAADDVRYAAADVADAIHVLVVNGEPSSDSFDDEVTFLITALAPEGEVFSGVRTTIVDEAQLEEVNLTSHHVVVLANVYRISEPAVESLERFVRRGGGLLVFLGDQVDPDLYNAALYRGGEGLLPAELLQQVRAASASHLVITDRLHPAMRGLSKDGDPLGIGQIPFFEYFASVPIAGVQPNEDDVDNVGVDFERSQPIANVIARFDDANQHAAIIERSFGKGQVMLFTSAIDKEWHLWPDHPTYLPVITELVRHCASHGNTTSDYWVGDTIEVAIDPAEFEPEAVLRTPNYPNDREIGLTAVPAEDGRGLKFVWEDAATSGIYRLVLNRREGGEHIRLIAVNIDPSEGDLWSADQDELVKAAGDLPVTYFDGISDLSGSAGEPRFEMWRACLFAALGILMTEQCLGWWWGRKR